MNVARRSIAWTSALVAAVALAAPVRAQAILFDFNNAPLHAPLPIDQTAGGVTAHLSATGQGFSVQDSSAPVVPIGFTGRFIYPNSVYQADLLISFSQPLTDFSIRYSPQELGCDNSATMRVTARLGGVYVGTNTHTAASPGTWPVDTLSCSFPQGFDSVVVHYDAPPPTCTDYGVIFLADDMRVTPLPPSGTPFCFGDSGCPCGNNSAAGSGQGCRNSTGVGALLTSTGTPLLASDSLSLGASNLPIPAGGSGFVTFFQGTTQSSAPFHDGKRCAAGTVVRLGTKTQTTGAVAYPQAGDLPIHVRGTIPAAGVRTYQAWYRNVAGPCGTGSNLTNGVSVTWAP